MWSNPQISKKKWGAGSSDMVVSHVLLGLLVLECSLFTFPGSFKSPLHNLNCREIAEIGASHRHYSRVLCLRTSGGNEPLNDSPVPKHKTNALCRSQWTRKILVTGGCGFFGSAVVDFLTVNYKDDLTVTIDRVDECASVDNIKDAMSRENFVFIKGDVAIPSPIEYPACPVLD